MNDCLLVVITKPTIEGALMDWLLAQETLTDFSSAPIAGYSAEHSRLSIAEQVRGRRNNIMFQVKTTRSEANRIVEDLKKDFAGAGLHYWLTPVLAEGRI